MQNIFPYLEGIGCSLCYGLATILQQVAAKRQETIESLNPSHLLRLFRQGPFILGIVLDLVGWGLFLLAARTLPLFLVLAFVASSLGTTALVARLFLATKSSMGERLAIVAVMVGIILLGITAEPSTARAVNRSFTLGIEWAPIPMAIIGAGLLKARGRRYGALLLALLAGLAFGGTGVIARFIEVTSFGVQDIFQPLVLSLVAYGALGMYLLPAALQRDSVNRVNGMLYSSELAVPSLLGIAFLGDRARAGTWPFMLAGFVFVAAGTILIARDGQQPAPHSGGSPGGEPLPGRPGTSPA